MGDVIRVNFHEKRKIEKYRIDKYLCSNCLETTIHDSRIEKKDPFVSFECNKYTGLCKECAVKVKGACIEQGWE